MQVGTDFMTWSHDECFVFDESCEHAVFVPQNMSSIRVVLIVDFANPLLLHKKDYLEGIYLPDDLGSAETYEDLHPKKDQWADIKHDLWHMKFNFINDIKNKFILFKNGEENNVYLIKKGKNIKFWNFNFILNWIL